MLQVINSFLSTSKLTSDGGREWTNLNAKFKIHETNSEHIINLSSWIGLEMRLLKNKTIDKNVQG